MEVMKIGPTVVSECTRTRVLLLQSYDFLSFISACPDGYIRCPGDLDDSCISVTDICNGSATCSDGSDETICGSKQAIHLYTM